MGVSGVSVIVQMRYFQKRVIIESQLYIWFVVSMLFLCPALIIVVDNIAFSGN